MYLVITCTFQTTVFARSDAALEQQPLLNSNRTNSSTKRNSSHSPIVAAPVIYQNFELHVVYYICMHRLTEIHIWLVQMSCAKKRSFDAAFKLKVVQMRRKKQIEVLEHSTHKHAHNTNDPCECHDICLTSVYRQCRHLCYAVGFRTQANEHVFKPLRL